MSSVAVGEAPPAIVRLGNCTGADSPDCSFRQSILAAACSGQLTADWREEHIDNEEWRVAKAADACDCVQNGSTPRGKPFLAEGIPFIKIYNIVDQKLVFDQRPQFVSREVHKGELKRACARPGDILMNIVGPPLGKVAIVPDTYPEWSINQALTMFRPGKNLAGTYLYYVLCSGIPYADILMETRGSAGQSNISLSQCRQMELPIAPLDEQQEIVRRVQTLFALADKIESRLRAATARVEKITQSILAKAFRGELVPTEAELARQQNRTYEPAAVLLNRIRATRTAAKPGKQLRSKGHQKRPAKAQ
jgi:type I restriction enzyme, S subunit